MGLAVLPARLKEELRLVGEAMLGRGNLDDEKIAGHAAWARDILSRREVTEANVTQVLQEEVGHVFTHVLEHAGVYAPTPACLEAFLRFLHAV